MVDEVSYDGLYLCHEYNEKKRCPVCGSLDTKKNGFIYSRIFTLRGLVKRKTQRYYCHHCGKSFTHFGINKRKKTSDDLKKKVVFDYVQSKSSLGDIGRRYGISRTTTLTWLHTLSTTLPLRICIDKSLCSGIIEIDGKEIKLKGRKKTVFLSIDAKTKQPLTLMVCDGENTEAATQFLQHFKKHYPRKIRGIISDFGRGKCFLGVVKKLLPDVPHQICLVHYQRYIWLFIPRTKRSKYYLRNALLKALIKNVIHSSTREESLLWLEKINHLKPFFRASYHKRFIRSINKNYDVLTSFYNYDFLNTNTNLIENIIRQLERKLKNLDGFKSDKNLDCFIKLWFKCYHDNIIL